MFRYNRLLGHRRGYLLICVWFCNIEFVFIVQHIMILIKHFMSLWLWKEDSQHHFTSVIPLERCCKHASCRIYYYLHYRSILTIKMVSIASVQQHRQA